MRPIQNCYSAYIKPLLLTAGLLFAHATHGSAQTYQPLSASVQISFNHFISDQAPPKLTFAAQREYDTWLNNTSRRLERHIPDAGDRVDFLKTVYYEATRAGLDPQLVLGLIQVESGFKKYAVSSVGARGYMQVMPFWLNLIGQREGNLFHLRTNLRYGCIILRHYLDMEKGNLYRALGRYNGSLGKPEYPNLVNAAWHKR
ncbi:MAG: lytic transglycosylase domain-containing protein [Candidatus Nitrotoga sp.]